MEESAIDLVHATAFPYAWPILCGLRMARIHRTPFVLTPFLHLGDPQNPQDPTRRGYLAPPLRYLLHSADHLFVQTRIEQAALEQYGIPGDRITLAGLGVDPWECTGGDRERSRSRWQISPDAVVIGHLANQSEEKGTVDLLQAAQILWRRGEQFYVMLAGPRMPNFERFWRRFEAQDRVLQLGVLPETDKPDFFAALDLFAMPSRSDSFGLVFLEAWANGLPCVAYRAGGVAEVIHEESDGLLVPCGAVVDLAEALSRLLKDSALRQRLGSTGRQRVLREHDWAPHLHQVREVYRALVLRAAK
jgi:glycosyltransferase involved in cell wall biosynthesis